MCWLRVWHRGLLHGRLLCKEKVSTNKIAFRNQSTVMFISVAYLSYSRNDNCIFIYFNPTFIIVTIINSNINI